jgi:hypothetical protein
MLPGANVKSCYGIKRPEVTNLAKRETAILGIKPEKMNKTSNLRSSVTIRGVPVIFVAVNKVELLHILNLCM